MRKNTNSDVKRALCFGCWLQAGVLSTGAVTFGPLLCRIYPLKKYA